MSVNTVFTRAFDAITDELPYNPKWSNGTGYHDYAVNGGYAPTLRPGQIVKSRSPGNRRLILIGTRLGNVVIFDRYKDQEGRDDVIFVYNATNLFKAGRWTEPSGPISEEVMATLLGEWGEVAENIGWRLEMLYEAMKASEAGHE